VQIFRQTGSTSTRIFSGVTGCMASSTVNAVRIKIIRDDVGNWTVFSDCSGGMNYVLEGQFFDNTHSTTQHFGVYCRYSTNTRYNMYYFDDFYVGEIIQ